MDLGYVKLQLLMRPNRKIENNKLRKQCNGGTHSAETAERIPPKTRNTLCRNRRKQRNGGTHSAETAERIPPKQRNTLCRNLGTHSAETAEHTP
jgi:hypothetical protein